MNRIYAIVVLMLFTNNVLAQAPGPFDVYGFLPDGIDLNAYKTLYGDLEQDLSDPPGPWRLMFFDDFNGSSIDNTKWIISDDATPDGPSAHKPGNVSVGAGILKLDIKEEYYNGAQYTSGEIKTSAIDPKTIFDRGMFEARIKFPGAYWSHSCFWVWADLGAGEIDIAEYWARNGYSYLKGHYFSNCAHNFHEELGSNKYDAALCLENLMTDALYEDYHIYRVIWDKNFYYFYIDGNFTHKMSKLAKEIITPPNYSPVYVNYPNDVTQTSQYYTKKYRLNDYFFSLNYAGQVILGTGLDLKDNAGTENTNAPQGAGLPATMYVDWVRVYQRSECEIDEIVTNARLYNHEWLSVPTTQLDKTDEWGTYKGVYMGTQFNESWTNGTYTATDNWDNVIPHTGEAYYKGKEVVLYPNYECSGASGNHFTFIAKECETIESEYIVPDYGNKTSNSQVLNLQNSYDGFTYLKNDKIADASDVTIYPNPTNGTLIISKRDSEICDLTVQNLLGQEIYKTTISQKRSTVTLNDLPTGTYTVKVVGQTINHSEKLTIQK